MYPKFLSQLIRKHVYKSLRTSFNKESHALPLWKSLTKFCFHLSISTVNLAIFYTLDDKTSRKQQILKFVE